MIRLIIARHGNTFDKGDVIRRVGLRTNLPLSISGRKQAVKLGKALPDITDGISLSECYVSELSRTQETAKIAIKQLPAPESFSDEDGEDGMDEY